MPGGGTCSVGGKYRTIAGTEFALSFMGVSTRIVQIRTALSLGFGIRQMEAAKKTWGDEGSASAPGKTLLDRSLAVSEGSKVLGTDFGDLGGMSRMDSPRGATANIVRLQRVVTVSTEKNPTIAPLHPPRRAQTLGMGNACWVWACPHAMFRIARRKRSKWRQGILF